MTPCDLMMAVILWIVAAPIGAAAVWASQFSNHRRKLVIPMFSLWCVVFLFGAYCGLFSPEWLYTCEVSK